MINGVETTEAASPRESGRPPYRVVWITLVLFVLLPLLVPAAAFLVTTDSVLFEATIDVREGGAFSPSEFDCLNNKYLYRPAGLGRWRRSHLMGSLELRFHSDPRRFWEVSEPPTFWMMPCAIGSTIPLPDDARKGDVFAMCEAPSEHPCIKIRVT
jgi:hypothetical protein